MKGMVAIRTKDFKEMISHAKKEYPKEACGMLAGKDQKVTQVYPVTNIDESAVTYFMDPQEQFKAMKDIQEKNLELLGIYHSHVATVPFPSPKDVELAFYPEATYFIISLENFESPKVKAYRINQGKIEEQNYKVLR